MAPDQKKLQRKAAITGFLLKALVGLLIGLAITGLAMVVGGLVARPIAGNVILAGNALIFGGLTALIIIFNLSLASATWTHTLLGVNPSLVIQPPFVLTYPEGQLTATVFNNSAAPAHAVRLSIWPLATSSGDSGWQIRPGYGSLVGEIAAGASAQAYFISRQTVMQPVDDLNEGQAVANALVNQGVTLKPEGYLWKLEWFNAHWQPGELHGGPIVSWPMPAVTPETGKEGMSSAAT
jgi:hypothetical protein